MTETVLSSLNDRLHAMMGADDRVYLIGEDLLDPYGGAFKVAKGLSTAFPDRVWTTPISEAGFVGVAAGMAMRGLRPIVEIMFGDFLMLTADQILNHITKYRWMYDDQIDVPLVIRAPMGGRRGYGPTHSQSIEKHFLGMPGLIVVAPSPFHRPGELLEEATRHDERPVLFVENKLMYARRLQLAEDGRVGDLFARQTDASYPTTSLSYTDFDDADVTVVAYGGMAELAQQATEAALMQDEIYGELIVPSSLQPLDLDPIVDSLSRTGRLVVCEEGTATAGWGSHVISQVTTRHFDALKASPRHVAAREFPIANAPTLEKAILPQVDDIRDAIQSVASESASSGLRLDLLRA